MSQFLFLNQPAVGHLNALLSIACRLSEAGHTVRFLVPGVNKRWTTGIDIFTYGQDLPALIRRQGLMVDLLPPHLSLLWDAWRLPSKSGYAETSLAFRMFFRGLEYYARYVRKHIESFRPDVLVSDFAFPAASLAADMAGLPYATVYHSGLPFRGPGIPPFGSGLPIAPAGREEGGHAPIPNAYLRREKLLLDDIDRRMAKARTALGLPSVAPDFLRRPYSPWLNLVASASVLEAPRDNLTTHTFYVGPCTGHRRELPFAWDGLLPEKFKVYISLGTVFNNKPEVFRKLLRALANPDYQVLVSAGGAYSSLMKTSGIKNEIPANALIYRSVPQLDLLSRVDLFISHGGNNSTNEALAAGKPILVLPVGGEQADNASRIVYLGVGMRADIAKFTEAEIINQVEALRRDRTFRERAHAIGEQLKPLQGTLTAALALAALAEHKKPLHRTQELPITVTTEQMRNLICLVSAANLNQMPCHRRSGYT